MRDLRQRVFSQFIVKFYIMTDDTVREIFSLNSSRSALLGSTNWSRNYPLSLSSPHQEKT